MHRAYIFVDMVTSFGSMNVLPFGEALVVRVLGGTSHLLLLFSKWPPECHSKRKRASSMVNDYLSEYEDNNCDHSQGCDLLARYFRDQISLSPRFVAWGRHIRLGNYDEKSYQNC